MLAIDEKSAKKIGSYFQIAVQGKGAKRKPIFAVTSNYLRCKPCIMSQQPSSLLDRSDWLKYIKRYRLSNKDIKRLKSVWALGSPNFESPNPRAVMAFKEIEEELVKRMRSNYRPNKGDIFPWFEMDKDNHSPNNCCLIASTSAGKTRWLNELATSVNSKGENFITNRPIVCFSCHPGDPSLKEARAMHKRRWTDIDLNKIDQPITLEMVEPGSYLIFDDCMNLPKHDPRTKVLYDLVNEVAVRGRHHRSKKGNGVRGCEFCLITHYGSDKRLNMVRNASKYWVLFPQASRSQSVHILRTRLHRTKKQVEKLLDRCGDSRFCLVRMHHPMMCISSNHCELVN